MEAFVDLSKLSIEEIIGTLKSSDDAEEETAPPPNSSPGKLLLTHEEWVERYKSQDGGRGGSGSGGRGKTRGRGGGRGSSNSSGGGSSNSDAGASSGRAGPGDLCKHCGKRGHWAQHCRGKLKVEDQAHVAQEEEEHALLLTVSVDQEKGIDPQFESELVPTPSAPAPAIHRDGHLHLLENKVLAAFDDANDRDPKRWVLDTGASNHMSGSRAAFSDLDGGVTGSVRFGDGSVARIEGIGTVLLACKSGEHRALAHVYYLPRLTANIISVGQLDETGYQVLVEDGVMQVRDEERRLLAKIHRNPSRLYVLDVDIAQPVCYAAHAKEDAWLWHARYGHVNFDALRRTARDELVRGMPLLNQVDQLCDACLAGKHRRTPFPQRALSRTTKVLELLHGDLCGPVSLPTPSGNRYFLLLVDEHSRWIALLPIKDGAATAIKRIQAAAERKTGERVCALRTDRGGEFLAKDFEKYCAELGLRCELTAPYSPPQNDVVERRNQTMMSTARSMLKAKELPGIFWGEAVTTVVYLLNRAPSKGVGGKIPYQLWTGSAPGVHHLRTFGCVAHMKITTPNLKKLNDRSCCTIFVGYEARSKAYRLYDPSTRRVHVSRDVIFDEAAQWN
jgi:transposase InsO family protein